MSATMSKNCLRIYYLTKILVISCWTGIFKRKKLFPRHFIQFSFYLGSMGAARKKTRGKRKKKGRKEKERNKRLFPIKYINQIFCLL